MEHKYITVAYKLYTIEEGERDFAEEAPVNHPFQFISGLGLTLDSFEEQVRDLNKGDKFDFTIPCAEAYGEYDDEGVLTLDKKMFYNGDGEFDSERVYVGAIVPMNTVDGQIINAQIAEITKDNVTIDLNHPLAGENLHFVGKVLNVRDVTEGELKALHHRGCGGCHGKCGDCESSCGGDCGGECNCN